MRATSTAELALNSIHHGEMLNVSVATSDINSDMTTDMTGCNSISPKIARGFCMQRMRQCQPAGLELALISCARTLALLE